MSFNPNDLAEELRLAGIRKANSAAAAKSYTETRKHFLKKLMIDADCQQISRAEMIAEGSEEYKQYVLTGVELERVALIDATHYESVRCRIDLIRSLEATNRAQMNL